TGFLGTRLRGCELGRADQPLLDEQLADAALDEPRLPPRIALRSGHSFHASEPEFPPRAWAPRLEARSAAGPAERRGDPPPVFPRFGLHIGTPLPQLDRSRTARTRQIRPWRPRDQVPKRTR